MHGLTRRQFTTTATGLASTPSVLAGPVSPGLTRFPTTAASTTTTTSPIVVSSPSGPPADSPLLIGAAVTAGVATALLLWRARRLGR